MSDSTDTYLGQILMGIKGTLAGAATLLVATADAVTNTMMTHVVGNKTDAGVTTVGTTKSIMAYAKGCLSVLVHGTYGLSALKTLIDSKVAETVTTVTKSVTVTTTGAQVYDLFILVGMVNLRKVKVSATTVTDSTTLNKVAIRLMPAGGSAIDITESTTGLNMSGCVAGAAAIRTAAKTSALTSVPNALGGVTDGAVSASGYLPVFVNAKTGVATTLQLSTTNDGETNVVMKVEIEYEPITVAGVTGSLTAV